MQYELIEGTLNAKDMTVAIVCARFNGLYSERLLEGAIDAIERHGGSKDLITVVRVPGSFEIPLACKELASSKKYKAIVALGVVIDGATDHYRLVVNELASGLSKVMHEYSIPVTFGVLTCDTAEKAAERSGGKAGNKGWECAVAAIEMVNVLEEIRSKQHEKGLKAVQGK